MFQESKVPRLCSMVVSFELHVLTFVIDGCFSGVHAKLVVDAWRDDARM